MFKGKAIYKPAGKAKEYAEWACNFYVGCSSECTYCYLKQGRGAKILGGNIPTLKKCFKDEEDAIEIFEKELLKNLDEIREDGIFFSFSTDPAIKETFGMTVRAINTCMEYYVPVTILTKSKLTAFTMFNWVNKIYHNNYKNLVTVGITLTRHDELEPNADTNQERITGLSSCYNAGFKTFVSIEPIIDFPSSKKMIEETVDVCNMYKIGINKGQSYDKYEAVKFATWVKNNVSNYMFKDSFKKLIGE